LSELALIKPSKRSIWDLYAELAGDVMISGIAVEELWLQRNVSRRVCSVGRVLFFGSRQQRDMTMAPFSSVTLPAVLVLAA